MKELTEPVSEPKDGGPPLDSRRVRRPAAQKRFAKSVPGILALAALAIGLFSAAATAGEPMATATVNVTITVLPYAEVCMDQTTLSVTISPGQTVYGPVYVGGTVTCNCPVMLFARIGPPAGAPGTWAADTMVARIAAPGVFYYGQLLRVVVWDIPSDYAGGSFGLQVSGRFAATMSQIPAPGVGEVMLTVVPE